jgi:branched-chain amino acid transport system ATP-binding protein
MALLSMDDLHTYYGRVHALKGISLDINEGEVVTLIGANGAGKTTTLRTISGLIRPRQGKILFGDQTLNTVPAYKIVEMGISHAPEGRKIFATLTVLENLNMGAYRLGNNRAEIKAHMNRVFQLFPRIADRQSQLAGTLSGGEQQMLCIGRALMANPKLLLLDEPSLGLAPMLVKTIFDTVRQISDQGVTILLVEQNARAALRLADKAYVLETGRIVLSGRADELLRDERVRRAYLGEN